MIANATTSRPSHGPKRTKLTVELPRDLVEKLRDAAFWLSGPPHQLTLTAITEQALQHELERIQLQLNEGKEFDTRTSPLKVGRPIAR
jgi:predicted transcriptional regulator